MIIKALEIIRIIDSASVIYSPSNNRFGQGLRILVF